MEADILAIREWPIPSALCARGGDSRDCPAKHQEKKFQVEKGRPRISEACPIRLSHSDPLMSVLGDFS